MHKHRYTTKKLSQINVICVFILHTINLRNKNYYWMYIYIVNIIQISWEAICEYKKIYL